ncbi:hypothetical protein N7495_003212 [Penicillium taxi]|uniref:uncharacterized protein n=1 Tax=Penicillium taxi TaxID=168475 RepID=UPI002545287E|nr:uncharacterized protein N7495_003212 [Penicillium taxi]KAJ5902684.1 hypothetical protein N7495_003212 [Penicillium taxi]
MATTISYDSINSGFQAGVIHGNVENITVVQSETLNRACLRDLRTTNPLDDKERIKNTKGGLLKDSYGWILDNEDFKRWEDNQSNRLLWIKGDPGKGKTMLLCGIIEELTRLYGDNANISFFFCQATDMRINSATSVLRGLIYLLVEKHPFLLPHVRARYDHAGKALFEDVNAWNALSTIFKDILKDPALQMTYLVIDALDECTSGLYSLLDLIIQESSVNLPIKWVLSSRNWPDITERLNTATQLSPVSLELNEASVSDAVNHFIQHKVRGLAKTKSYTDKTRNAVQSYLLSNSQGTFLWVALVCQNLKKIRTSVLKKLELFPPGLDALYGRMIDQVCESQDAEICKKILAIMSTVFRPITLNELASLIEPPDDDSDDFSLLKEIIALCGSFLTLRQDTITFVHQSAKDFLLREAVNEILPRGIGAEHRMIFSRSLNVMFKTLRRDIFDIKLPGFPIKDVKKPNPNPLAAAEYACVHWVDHLQGSECNETYKLSLIEMECMGLFLQQKFLYWLEALSILGSVTNGIQAMQNFETLLQVEETWSLCLHTLEVHNSLFNSIAWSSDGSRLASASVDATVRIWDPTTGQNLSTLKGHSDRVTSVAWSPDGSRLASASWDYTVRIWDPATGQTVFTLEGHSGWVRSVVWSPDGSRLASASSDKTVRIWDPTTGHGLSTLERHSDRVTSAAWSSDGSRLASASWDYTVKIWDPATGQTVSTIEGHSVGINSIAWSPDGSRLASASNDGTVRIWDPATGQTVSTLEGHSDGVRSVAWSPDGSRLASASVDATVRIWDPATGQSVSNLKGHNTEIISVAWSPDGSRLASASWDYTVRIWDLNTSQGLYTPKWHGGRVASITWSPDGSRLASASSDATVRIWDPATGQTVSTLEGHSDSVSSVAWSPDGSRLASASVDATVRIWDLTTGQSLSTLEGHSDWVRSVAWSPDGSRLASASSDATVRIWDPATGQTVSTLEGHSDSVSSVAWSPDGSRLASASDDETVRIWDLITSHSLSTLEGHSDRVTSVVWSPDGSRLASASSDKTVRIWDPTTGQSVSTLSVTFRYLLQFDKSNFNHLHTNMGTFDIASVTLRSQPLMAAC